MRKISISQDLIQDLYINQGLTTYQIAERLRFCQGTIWKRLGEYGIKPRLSYLPVNFSKKQLKNWYIDQKLSTWEIEKRFGYSRSTLYRKLKEFGFQTRNIATSHIRIGDLNVTKCGPQSETIVVKCASTKQGQLILFKNLFGQYGHIIQGKPTKEDKINIQASINSSFSFLLEKRPSSYKWVFKNKKTFLAFLAGFSDAEGSFFFSRGMGVFSIGNYDKLLLTKIRKFLKRFGVETPQLAVYYQINRKMYRGYISRNDYYTLRCSRKDYLLKLISILQPYTKHPDKLQKAQLIKENIIERNLKFGNLNQTI